MQLKLQDRVALVTGAGRGIGRAIALAYAAAGATVLCVSRTEKSCGAVADEIKASGGQAEAMAVDVADAAAVAAAAKELLGRHENIDILVNNAGITRDGLLLRMTDEAWDEVLRTNLFSCFYWTRALAHPMTRKRWGRIVNVSSVVGQMGNAGQANYAAAKAGMIGFTKSVAREFASRNVTANAIAPGFIETDMTAELDARVIDHVKQTVPLKKLGSSDDIAGLATFLATDASAYITGQVFTVDGGMRM